VLSRAEEVLASGDARLACHLVEFAALAAPTNADVWSVRARVYAAHSATHTSSMARNLLRHASIASEQGKRDLAGDY
jgi:Tfp pilus assembly protein PilF